MGLRPAVRRLAVALVLFAALPARAVPPREDSVLEFLRLALDMEKRGAADDFEEFERVTGRLARAEGDLSGATDRLARLIREGADLATAQSAEDALADAEARVRSEQERRRLLSSRIAERVRRAAALREEIVKRRGAGKTADDPLTGRWDVAVNPGGRRGVLRLVLDGALVWGDYTFDGGFRGSIRGQLAGDRLSFERIDVERGFDARFYGRLTTSPRRLTGTWEATAIAPSTGPPAGSWSAVPGREPEDGDKP